MFKKGLAAAGFLAAALAAAPQTASAGTTVNVGVGGGWGYRCGYYNHWCGHPYGWGYHPYGWYAPGPGRLSCAQAARIVWNHGFSHVVPVRCGGPWDIYDATRGGRHWRVRVNVWNGRIAW
jgi:hypothetical protein